MQPLIRSTVVLLVLAAIVASLGQRLVGSDFRPAAAGEGLSPTQSIAELDLIDATAAPLVEIAPEAPAEVITTTPPTAASAPANSIPEVVTPSTVAAIAAAPAAPPSQVAPSQVAPAPAVAPAPVPTAPPAPPAPTAAPVVVAPVATPAPAGCPATWFCYPRVGIAGPIVPYSDCGGTTDIGTSIRSFTCLSPFYLMGHAYTQFGQITLWRAGDIVFASGRQFTITGAFTQSSCAAPARAIAPLSLQTSLTSGGCGSVLVVQGN